MTPLRFALILGIISLAAWLPFLIMNRMRDRRPKPQASSPEESKALKGGGDMADVSRRKFLLRGTGLASATGLAMFGLVSLDFMYPRLRGGFGSRLSVGSAEELAEEISSVREPVFIPDGRFYLSLYEGDPEEANQVSTYRAANVAESGFMALYRKCVHLGCSVPWCPPSKWFECPCHGSKYSINGEYRDGPAPRGLDQFRVEVVDGEVFVDTSTIIQGAPRGTTTGQPQPEGEHCVSIAE